MFWLYVATVLTVLLFVKTLFGKRTACTVPYGDKGHWLFGNLIVPRKDWMPMVASWTPRFGPLVRFQFLPFMPWWSIVFVNDIDMSREIMASKEFSNRDKAEDAGMIMMNPLKKGIIFGDYTPEWKQLHKMSTSILKLFGFGKNSMEKQILSEADVLISTMLAKSEPFAPRSMLQITISNIISMMVFSERTEIGKSSRIHESLSTYGRGFWDLVASPVYAFNPRLVNWFHTPAAKKIHSAFTFTTDYIRASVKEHEASLNPNEIRDFIDAFILEQRKNPESTILSDDQLENVVRDLFIAGTETTSTSLEWAIARLLHHPNIAAKLKEEVYGLLGYDGVPSMAHQPQLPYVQAFIDELMRFFIYGALPHRCQSDQVLFHGYTITSKESIWLNFWAFHHNPEFFPDPENFDPTRFIDENGKKIKNPNLIAFGLGDRRCLGEKLASMMLFLFVVRFVQRLDFVCSTSLPSLDYDFGVAPIPGPFKITVNERKHSCTEEP